MSIHVNVCSYHRFYGLPHLAGPHLISTELSRTLFNTLCIWTAKISSRERHDAMRMRKHNVSDLTRSDSSDWSQPRRTGSLHCRSVQMKWGQLNWDETCHMNRPKSTCVCCDMMISWISHRTWYVCRVRACQSKAIMISTDKSFASTTSFANSTETSDFLISIHRVTKNHVHLYIIIPPPTVVAGGIIFYCWSFFLFFFFFFRHRISEMALLTGNLSSSDGRI